MATRDGVEPPTHEDFQIEFLLGNMNCY